MECSLDIAVGLVNTEDPLDPQTDQLATIADLESFLREHELSDLKRPTAKDLKEVRELRSTLRRVFAADDQQAAVGLLNELLAASGARPSLTNHDGPWHLHYSPPGTPLAPRLMAETAMALSVVIAEDGFERLRTCDGENCEDVFVDASRNRSRRYCSPDVCGNRASVAAFRARQRAAGSD